MKKIIQKNSIISGKQVSQKLAKGIKVFLKKRKRKIHNIVGNYVYENFLGNEKQKLVEHRKKFDKIWKNKTALQIKSDNHSLFSTLINLLN